VGATPSAATLRSENSPHSSSAGLTSVGVVLRVESSSSSSSVSTGTLG